MEYSSKELGKLFDQLSPELKEAILSEETAERIRQISKRYKLEERNVSEVAKLIGKILLGLLPPEELPVVLETALSLENERAKNISREVNRFILYPVKQRLAELYSEVRFMPGGRVERKKAESGGFPLRTKTETTDDIYREEVE